MSDSMTMLFELAGPSEGLLFERKFGGRTCIGISNQRDSLVARHSPPFRRLSAHRTVINLMYVLYHIPLAI